MVEEPGQEPGKEPVASEWTEFDQEPKKEDEPSASEDEEQKAWTEEEEPLVEPFIPKDITV
jgi:hypothetical protein